MSIRPESYTLGELLQGRLFRIPDYQRAYSWESKQRNDLFEDLHKLDENENPERKHFMSTVVCLKTGQKEELGTDEFGIFHVVDGQQRLTTLIIILKALAKKLSGGDDLNKIEKKESERLQELLVKEEGELILLQTNHDNQYFFRNYLEDGFIPDEASAETLADKNMIMAFQECENFVNEWQPNPLSLLKLVKNRLDFILYVLEDEGAVHTTFEVLNSRGLPVDWLDKCKSVLMGIAFKSFGKDTREEYIQQLHKSWSNIYRTIGLKKVQGEEILKFTATLEYLGKSKVLGSEDSLEYFREKCETNPKSVIKVSDQFLKIAQNLEYLVTNPRIKAVTKISHARLLAVAIMLKKDLGEAEKKLALEVWEKVTFRIFGISRKDARTKVGEYVRLAREIHTTEEMTVDDIVNRINILGEDYPINEAIKGLEDADCYQGWENELVYFFYRYEEFLNSEFGGSLSKEVWEKVWNNSPAKTVEHIHPQGEREKAWIGKFATEKESVEKQVQRLGNLVILPPGVNSQASDKAFPEKKEIYRQHQHLKLMDEILEKEDWNLDTLKEREERLLAWAKEEWG